MVLGEGVQQGGELLVFRHYCEVVPVAYPDAAGLHLIDIASLHDVFLGYVQTTFSSFGHTILHADRAYQLHHKGGGCYNEHDGRADSVGKVLPCGDGKTDGYASLGKEAVGKVFVYSLGGFCQLGTDPCTDGFAQCAAYDVEEGDEADVGSYVPDVELSPYEDEEKYIDRWCELLGQLEDGPGLCRGEVYHEES